MARNLFRIEGMDKLKQAMKEMERIPQRCVTKAARRGGSKLLKVVRAAAPIETGTLRRGIVLKGEKSRKRGKRVFQVVFSKFMNDEFVKISKEGKRAYYPASMEYGFQTRNGGYIPGEYFMRTSADSNANVIRQEMVDVLAAEIDKLR